MTITKKQLIQNALKDLTYYWDLYDEVYQVPEQYEFTLAELEEYAIENKIPMISTQQFINDINEYIKNHNFLKQYDIEAEEDDQSNLELHTVDGEYERIQIIYNLIG